jgi:hypothetical protein
MRDVGQAFRRMVFNVLRPNRDDQCERHLAPAFDRTIAPDLKSTGGIIW